MEVLLSFLIVAALSVTFVEGAGYLQVRPPTLGQCYYEDINTAHFSYNRTFCEGKNLSYYLKCQNSNTLVPREHVFVQFKVFSRNI